jgi:hypothetical protein
MKVFLTFILFSFSTLAMAQNNMNYTNDSKPLVSNIKPVDFKTFHLVFSVKQNDKKALLDLDMTNHEAETTHVEEQGLSIDYYFLPEMEEMNAPELPIKYHIKSQDMSTGEVIEKEGLIEINLHDEPVNLHIGNSLIILHAHENHSEY